MLYRGQLTLTIDFTIYIMALKLNIINAAFVKIGEPIITSLEDGTRNAIRAAILFPVALDEILSTHSWTEALREISFTGIVDISGSHGGYKILKLLDTTSNSSYKVLGNVVTVSGTVVIRCIVRLLDTTDFGPFLTSVLIARLVFDFLGSRPGQKNLARQDYLLALREAVSSDSQQGGADDILEFDRSIITMR